MSKKQPENSIAVNKKARFDYTFEQHFEAGLVLQGWEIKSIRAGRTQLKESYVIFNANEAWLIGAHISPLLSASTHIKTDPIRPRKLLLNSRELHKLHGAITQKGYTIVPVSMYWKKGFVKLDIALAKGKKAHDKRASDKDKSWERDKQRLVKKNI